jgi:hypothetical protein
MNKEDIAAFRAAIAEDIREAGRKPQSALHLKIDAFLATRGIDIDHHPLRSPVAIGDEGPPENKGQFITKWDAEVLGKPPTEVDGFTANELRRFPA